jgi:Leucine-rich repeat (LRR) protein
LNDISCLPLLATIEEVSLNGNDLHNVDDLAKLPKLRSLELRNNRIREIDVSEPGFRSLISLDIRGNSISSLKFATQMPQLLVLCKIYSNKMVKLS